MSKKLELNFNPILDDGNPRVTCKLSVLDSSLMGNQANFQLTSHVEVKDPRAINEKSVVFDKDFEINSPEIHFDIPYEQIKAYSYSGRMIEIKLRSQVKVDDALLFDTKLTQLEAIKLKEKKSSQNCAKKIVEPKDYFNIAKNLNAIPAHNRFWTIILMLLGGIVIIINSVIGIHDQMVPESQTFIYSHYDSDGDSNSPFIASLLGSGGLGAFLWFLIRAQLKKYMTFDLKPLSSPIAPGKSFCVSELISGKSRVHLNKAVLRIVCCNMEHGQYVRGSGTNQRTVSFKEPVNGLILYSKEIENIPPGVPIESYFNDKLSFDPMFEALYPPVMLSSTHGLNVHWEVQVLHDDFVDQELVASVDGIAFHSFIQAKKKKSKDQEKEEEVELIF